MESSRQGAPEEWDEIPVSASSRSSPCAQLCLPFQEHLLLICSWSALSPGFLGTDLPSLSSGELVGKFSAAPWGRVT